jgi:uncharacterized lipoprotein YbaY
LAPVLALTVVACGDSGPTTPTPTTIVVAQGSAVLADVLTALVQDRPCDSLAFAAFTTAAPGTLEATVDWTFGTNDVDVAIVPGACNCGLAMAEQCQNELASASSTTAKPERISVPNFAAGSYTLVIANFGPAQESVSYQVTLKR